MRDLDEKLAVATTAPDGEKLIILPSDGGLVTELDRKLQDGAAHREPEIIAPRFSERVPTWLGFALVTLIIIAVAMLVVRAWQPQCDYSQEFCQVAELDIDALRIAIPDSELIAALPNIDALDPNDELTAGEIFAMDQFTDLDFEALITDDEIDELLRPCLLYTSPSPRDATLSRMPSSA